MGIESHCASTFLPPVFYSIQRSTSQLNGNFTDCQNSRSGTTGASTADSTMPGWNQDIDRYPSCICNIHILEQEWANIFSKGAT